VASSGPYSVPAVDSQIVAFVLVGGRTVAEMQVNSDTAVQWYDPPVAVEERPVAARLVRGFEVSPKVSTGNVTVRYSLSRLEPLELALYDAAGREVSRVTHQPSALAGSVTFAPRSAGRGVYFLCVGDRADKVAIVR
jgi:hypothetical protein